MPLSLQRRQIGEITLVKCSGQIVEGPECGALQQHIDDLLPLYHNILLDLGDVQFVDSSGLGLLVRILSRTRTAGGHLVLCAVPVKVREVLEATRLHTVLEAHDAEAEAVAAFYKRAKTGGAKDRFGSEILCVSASADVLAYVRELLKQDGHGVTTADNLPDALTLLQATRPKLVVVGADLRAARNTRASETFNRLADALTVIELPADFARREAGDAGRGLLDQVRTVIN